MKSLLIDALRRVNAGETAPSLSDSGSFDTANREFGETANDEVVSNVEVNSEELELLKSTGVVIVADGDATELDDQFAEFATTNSSSSHSFVPFVHTEHITAPENAPGLARLSPLLCVLLAVTAAGSWFLYHYLEARYFRDVFDTIDLQSGADDINVGAQTAIDRFPFLDIPSAESDESVDGAGTTP